MGNTWNQDRYYSGGHTYAKGAGRRLNAPIKGTERDYVYQTERAFAANRDPTPEYDIPVPNGAYRVTLHFAEIHAPVLNKRIFDAAIENKPVLTNFDPGALGFETATEKTFEVIVKDGSLSIDLQYSPTARHRDPKLSGIEILRLQNDGERRTTQ